MNLALGRFLAQAEVIFEYRSPEVPGPANQRDEYRQGFLLFYDKCADFGLLERGARSVRKILHYHIEPRTAAILAYDLHFAGYGDNAVVADPVWALFGMDRADVLNELRRLALKGLFIVQTAGDVTRIAWQCKDLEELRHVLAQG